MNEITLRGFIAILGILFFVGILGFVSETKREMAQLKLTCQEVNQ